MDTTLAEHERIKDDSKLGWTCESNIYYNKNIFSLKEYGVLPLDIASNPHRGLFWLCLTVKLFPDITIFVSTAHLPWSGSKVEIETGINQRIPTCLKICEHFRQLVPPNKVLIFGGDFNDDFHPLRILNQELGMIDVFEALDLPPPITHPVRPSSPREEMRPSRTLDWITCTLPSNSRVLGAFVKSIRGGRYPPASDHLPVVAFFELGPPT